MKVTLLENVLFGRVRYAAGTVIDVPADVGKRLVSDALAKPETRTTSNRSTGKKVEK